VWVWGVVRGGGYPPALMLAHVGVGEKSVRLSLARGRWRKVLDSGAPKWRGEGSALPDQFDGGTDFGFRIGAHTLALYRRENVS